MIALVVAACRAGPDGDPPVALRRVADRRAAGLVSGKDFDGVVGASTRVASRTA